MKFNIEVDLDFIDEDYSLEENFKDELKNQISKQVASVLAKEKLIEFSYEEEGKKARIHFETELSKIREENQEKYDEIGYKVKSTLDQFLEKTSYKHNRWGEQEEKTTVEEFIKKELEKFMNDKKTSLEGMVEKYCDKNLSICKYEIEELVALEAKKIKNENAKKVAEFILKGAL